MGANIQQGLATSLIGDIYSTVKNIPVNQEIDRRQQRLDELSPSSNIPTQSLTQQWQGIQDWASRYDGWSQGAAERGGLSGFSATPREFDEIERQLENYRNPDGSIDFQAAAAAGVRLDLIGMDPSRLSPQDLSNSMATDRAATQAALDEDQQRALGLGEDVRAGMGRVNAGIDQTSGEIRDDFGNLMSQVNDVRKTAAQMPRQVSAYNEGQMAALQDQQKKQTESLGALIGGGFAQLAGERAEALKGIADNMAKDMAASTQSSRNTLNQNLARINSDPSLPPEARAKLSSQVSMQASMDAADKAAPVQRFYRELETSTQTSFSKIFSDFSSAAASTSASLAGAQQATTGNLASVHSQAYAQSVETTNKINSELAGIVQTAQATKGTNLAYLDNLRFQVENSGNTLLQSLLPLQSTPYVPQSSLDMEMFSITTGVDSLAYNEELGDIQTDLAQAGFNANTSAQTISGFQGMATPSGGGGSNGILPAAIGAGGTVAAAGIAAGSAGASGATATGLMTGKMMVLMCVDGHSMVRCPAGLVRMVHVKIGDFVLTPSGFREVLFMDMGLHHPSREHDYVKVQSGDLFLVLTKDHVVEGKEAGTWGIPHPAPQVSGDLVLEDASEYFANGFLVKSMRTLEECADLMGSAK